MVHDGCGLKPHDIEHMLITIQGDERKRCMISLYSSRDYLYVGTK